LQRTIKLLAVWDNVLNCSSGTGMPSFMQYKNRKMVDILL